MRILRISGHAYDMMERAGVIDHYEANINRFNETAAEVVQESEETANV